MVKPLEEAKNESEKLFKGTTSPAEKQERIAAALKDSPRLLAKAMQDENRHVTSESISAFITEHKLDIVTFEHGEFEGQYIITSQTEGMIPKSFQDELNKMANYRDWAAVDRMDEADSKDGLSPKNRVDTMALKQLLANSLRDNGLAAAIVTGGDKTTEKQTHGKLWNKHTTQGHIDVSKIPAFAIDNPKPLIPPIFPTTPAKTPTQPNGQQPEQPPVEENQGNPRSQQPLSPPKNTQTDQSGHFTSYNATGEFEKNDKPSGVPRERNDSLKKITSTITHAGAAIGDTRQLTIALPAHAKAAPDRSDAGLLTVAVQGIKDAKEIGATLVTAASPLSVAQGKGI